MNLDCDNLTGEDGGTHVLRQFEHYGNKLLYHQFDGDWHGGSYRRIGMHRSFFNAIGGYDESLEPMGHEDMAGLLNLAEAENNSIVSEVVCNQIKDDLVLGMLLPSYTSNRALHLHRSPIIRWSTMK